jgi:tetratricopeptide (TPR) repeat protein
MRNAGLDWKNALELKKKLARYGPSLLYCAQMTQSLSAWKSRYALILLVLASICGAYTNHFENSFHFDDSHTIVDNPHIRSLRNVPAFFTDTSTFSVLPSNRSWRPLLPLSLAIDYQIGHGLTPVAFHASTFLWFLLLVWLVYRFSLLIFERQVPPGGIPLAALAAAIYGLHPVCAETVNYIIQRGDLYATLGVLAGVYLYAARPEWRRFGIYLLPVIAGQLSKPPALIFPVILFAYAYTVEKRPLRSSLISTLPSVGVTILITVISSRMTPPSFNAGAVSAFSYRITQPYVALRYFSDFFLPLHLSADSDLSPISSFSDPHVIAGFAFLGLVIATTIVTCRRASTRPIGFGLIWFLAALAPTSLFPLAEVENDHRMFFPFIGLTISAVWAAYLALRPVLTSTFAYAAAIAILAALACGTHVRNEVWLNEATLWRDVTIKSPNNGRGLMNYGLTLMGTGDYGPALDYFNRAQLRTPNYYILEVNLGVIHGQLGHDLEAQQHFERALALASREAVPHYYYARWLDQHGRHLEALGRVRQAIALNPSFLPSQDLLRQIESSRPRWDLELARAEQTAKTPAQLLDLSLRYHQSRRYLESIRIAQAALKLQPDFPEAYNNLAAAFEELGLWDQAIQAATRAIELKPDFTLARNNLAWSLSQKGASTRKPAQ